MKKSTTNKTLLTLGFIITIALIIIEWRITEDHILISLILLIPGAPIAGLTGINLVNYQRSETK